MLLMLGHLLLTRRVSFWCLDQVQEQLRGPSPSSRHYKPLTSTTQCDIFPANPTNLEVLAFVGDCTFEMTDEFTTGAKTKDTPNQGIDQSKSNYPPKSRGFTSQKQFYSKIEASCWSRAMSSTPGLHTGVQVQDMKIWSGTNMFSLSCHVSMVPIQENTLLVWESWVHK